MRWTEDQLAEYQGKRLPPGEAVVEFAPSPMVSIDLPFPPSVNRLWRNCSSDGAPRVYLSPKYQKWKREADALMVTQKRPEQIKGLFEAKIVVSAPSRGSRGDLDNRIKAVFDWAQRSSIIKDDKNCERLTIEWGDTDHGCRLMLRALA